MVLCGPWRSTRSCGQRPTQRYTPAALWEPFSDDLSAAFRDLVIGLRSLLPVLLQLRRAAGLCLNLDKTNIVNFGTLPDRQLEEELCGALAIPLLRVRPEATSLGFVVTSTVSDQVWNSAVQKFMERVAYLLLVPGHTADRLVAYTTLAFSTLRYRARVHDPCTSTLRAEAAALASVVERPPCTPSTPLRAQLLG